MTGDSLQLLRSDSLQPWPAAMRPRRTTVVVVTGPPGSGTSTLGVELAGALRVPFLARDDIRAACSSQTGETMALLGGSCIVEYVLRRDRPHDIERLQAAAHCVVLITESADARERLVRRNLGDRLLNREAVLDVLGKVSSIEEHTSDAVRRVERVCEEMLIDFALPTMRIDTDNGLEHRLEPIIDFIATSASTVP